MPNNTLPFPTRTARFRDVVARCGPPEVHLSLVAPAKDRALQALHKRGRVLTVWQAHRGQRADYGVVGLFAEKDMQFLVFDRSLKPFASRRIVGIDYSLLESSPAAEVPAAPRPVRRQRGAASRPADTEAPPPEPAKPAEAEQQEEPDPPSLADIAHELRRIERMLASRLYTPARERVEKLRRRLQAGTE